MSGTAPGMTDRVPRATVIIACFNDGMFLREAIDSLAEQDTHELVVVDDGSTAPQTLAVLDALHGEGIHVVRQENAGLAAARRAGLAATSAPFVLPLDADDRLTPGALAGLADHLERNPDLAAVWGDMDEFGDVERHVPAWSGLDPWLVTHHNALPVASLFRRSTLDRVGAWASGDFYEDWDLWMTLAEHGMRGGHVRRTTFQHRIHGTSRLHQTFRRQHESVLALLHQRHVELMRGRRRNWLRSSLPLGARLVVPVLARLPKPATVHRQSMIHFAVTLTIPELRPRDLDGRPVSPIWEVFGRAGWKRRRARRASLGKSSSM